MFNTPFVVAWFPLAPVLVMVASHDIFRRRRERTLLREERLLAPVVPPGLKVALVGLGTLAGSILTLGLTNLVWGPLLVMHGLHVFFRARPLCVPALPIARAMQGRV